MALQDILQAISTHADEQIRTFRDGHKKRLRDMREESERRMSKAKQSMNVQKDQRKSELSAKAKTHAEGKLKSTLLQKKQELLDHTFADVLEGLCALDDAKVTTLLEHCLKRINISGTVHPAAKHEKLLKKIAPPKLAVGKPIAASGGFLFVSKSQEHDFTFEYIVTHILRPKTELSVSQQLFS